MTYPIGIFDVEDVATKINTLLSLDSTVVKNLVLVLQNDMQLKAHSSDIHFWNLLSDDKYHNEKGGFLLNILFISTYLCGSAFSTLNVIKLQYYSCLIDDHLD
jgi:hypothetical protein